MSGFRCHRGPVMRVPPPWEMSQAFLTFQRDVHTYATTLLCSNLPHIIGQKPQQHGTTVLCTRKKHSSS